MFYGSVVSMDEYFATMGYTTEVLTEAEKTALLANASAYIDALGYDGTRSRWLGTPADPDQIREFPRLGSDTPVRIETAAYEAAYYAASGEELSTAQRSDRVVLKESIDGISTTYAASDGVTLVVIPSVATLVARYMVSSDIGLGFDVA